MNKTAVWFTAILLAGPSLGALVASAAVGDVIYTEVVQLTLDPATGPGATLKAFIEARSGGGEAKAISCRIETVEGVDEWQCGLRVVKTGTADEYFDKREAGADVRDQGRMK